MIRREVTPLIWQSYRGVLQRLLVTDFRGDTREPISTWAGMDFTVCCRRLFVVERITVSDLVANKISGSGSCLIGKLKNRPHTCGRNRRKSQSKVKRTICTLYFAPSDQPTSVSLSASCSARPKSQETTKHTPKSFCFWFRDWVVESCLFIELGINTRRCKRTTTATHTQEYL